MLNGLGRIDVRGVCACPLAGQRHSLETRNTGGVKAAWNTANEYVCIDIDYYDCNLQNLQVIYAKCWLF